MDTNNQSRKSDEMTIWQKMDLIRAVSIYPALTLMVFIRRRVGYRAMKMNGVIIMAIIMMIYAELASSYSHESGAPLTMFALAMFGMAIFQRTMRWRELCQGVRWHTYCVGISYFEMIPWPPALAFMLHYRRLYRFLDPLAAILAGFLISTISQPLGYWIIFSGVALRICEEDLYERELARDLDTLDGMIASEVQSEAVKHFDGPQPDEKALALEDTAGIPTGVAPDIHRQVFIRRAKLAKAPDNLVAETPGAAA